MNWVHAASRRSEVLDDAPLRDDAVRDGALPSRAPIGAAAAGELTTAGHIPALDGVRGLAILLVLLHHETIMTTPTALDRGWRLMADLAYCGVDLFFVLSGFLITG